MKTLSNDSDTSVVDAPVVKPSEADHTFKTFLTSVTAPAKGEDTQKPEMHTVFLHNNDHTPFQTIVAILSTAFEKSAEEAERIMFTVHSAGPEGKGPVGTYTKDVAETKIAFAKELEAKDEHMYLYRKPLVLQFTMEKTEGA